MITIRLMTAPDISEIMRIRMSVRENHMGVEEMAAIGITPQSIEEMIKANPCAFVAQLNGSILGFAIADIVGAELFALFIEPRFEGMGAGSKLLTTAEEYLFSKHNIIRLTTAAQTRAELFYRHHGYVECSRERNDISFNKMRPMLANKQ